jgi:enoyl-[acyl-carrier protein] reductase II
MGADGVWVGTRFIATPEARAVNGYKDALVAAHEDGTVITRAYTGKTCRVLRNDWTAEHERDPSRLQPFPAQVVASMQAGVNHLGFPEGTEVDESREFYPAGQGVGGVDSIVPAGELVEQFVREAEAAIGRTFSALR